MAGSIKARVLPDPVSAIPTISLPLNTIGHDWHYIGVGF